MTLNWLQSDAFTDIRNVSNSVLQQKNSTVNITTCHQSQRLYLQSRISFNPCFILGSFWTKMIFFFYLFLTIKTWFYLSNALKICGCLSLFSSKLKYLNIKNRKGNREQDQAHIRGALLLMDGWRRRRRTDRAGANTKLVLRMQNLMLNNIQRGGVIFGARGTYSNQKVITGKVLDANVKYIELV